MSSYRDYYSTGTPKPPKADPGRNRDTRMQTSSSVERQFGNHVVIIGDCWAYNGDLSKHHKAYPMRTLPGQRARQIPAHWVSYEILVGPVPEGHFLHHTCENKGCVNPAHLKPMTPGDHMSHHQHLRASRK